MQKKKLILTSDGTQLRDFISLQEVCRVIGKITVANERFRAKQVFNLGSGASKSVLETAMLVRHRSLKVLGFAPELSFLTAGHSKTPATLSYGLKNLSTLNITVNDSTINYEVDNLLRFCSTNFTH